VRRALEERDEEALVLRVAGVERMGVRVDDRDAAVRRRLLQHLESRRVEAAGRVETDAGDTLDRLEARGAVEPTAAQLLAEPLLERPVRDAAEEVAGLGERLAERGEIHALSAGLAAFGEAEREPARVVERLVEGRHERDNRRADAVLERTLAVGERGAERLPRERGEPFVPVRVARDLVPAAMDAPHLHGVVIRTVSRERGLAHDRERGGERVRVEEVQDALRRRELVRAPRLHAAAAPRAVRAPLRVVVEEEEEPSPHDAALSM
jgi:hypothetical protein